jgi:hypothetical protein
VEMSNDEDRTSSNPKNTIIDNSFQFNILSVVMKTTKIVGGYK